MININELRQSLGAIQTEEVVELLNRLEDAESDAIEQARLNDMGASREAALVAKLETAEKERDALRAENAGLVDDMNLLRDNNTALRARIEAMWRQEPYAFAVNFPDSSRVELVHDLDDLCDDMTNEAHEVRKLYLAPCAQPAPRMVEAASGHHSLAMAWRAAINAAPEAKP